MALFTEISMDDYAKINARNQRNAAEKAAKQLQQKQAGLQAAQNKKTKTSLESALSGLVSGIGERIGDIGSTLNNIGKTVVGGINQIGKNKAIENTTKQDSERRNEIAKKYGFNSYSEAANSDKVGDDFWNEIKGSNEQTKKEQKKVTDNYRETGKYGDVTNVNTDTAKGQALNTIDSVLGVIPGVGGVVANVGGGAISGIGDEYKRAGREGGSFNLENALKNAAIGGASGLAGSAGTAGLSKVANKFGGNAVGKALGSNLASGISGGASAGAIGGALGTALNGGSLEDSLAAALEGAKAGGIGGGAMAGAMGLGGTTLDKIRNRGTTAQAIEPVDAETVQKNRIKAPTAERIPSTVEAVEPTNNRRGIAIKDYNAGVENIPVRVVEGAEPVPSRGKYIDSVVRRSDANLPEAQRPVVEQAPIYYHGSPETNLTEFDLSKAGKNTMSGERAIFFTDSAPTAEEFAYERIPTDSIFVNNKGKKGKVYQTNLDIKNTLDLDNLTDAQIAELWDYASPLGQLNGRDNFIKQMKYWRDEAKNPQLIKGNLDLGALANSDYDSFSATMYPNTGNTAKEYGIFDPTKATILQDGNAGKTLQDALTKIDVKNMPSIEDIIQVNRTQPQTVEPRYTESIIPARQYEQTIKAMPEAEITTPKTMATAETPTAQPQRQVAVGPADQARLERERYVAKQRQGEALLSQYGTLERPYRRMVGGDPAGVLNTLYDDYGLKTPQDVQFAANHVTGKNGTVSKMTRKLAASAENVPTAISEDFVNELLIDNGLNEAEMKSIKSQIQAVMNRTGENGYSDGATTLQAIKNLEGKIRDIKGESGTYHNMSYEDRCRASALQAVRDELTDRLWANADIKNVMTEDNLNTLRNMYKDNPTWQNFVDNKLANAKDGAELRALMKPLVNGAHIVEGSNMTAGSASEKVIGAAAKGGSAKGATKNILSTIVDITLNSDKAKQKRAEKYANQAKQAEAQLYGEAPVNTNTGKLGAIVGKAQNIAQGAKNIASGAADLANRATANLNNDSMAGINGIRTRKGNTIEFNALGNQAQQFANKQMGFTEAERSQDRLENARMLANAQNEYANALADYNAQEANYNAQMAQPQTSSMGSQLDRISSAMEMALNAGDITAYGQLADLYKQAVEIEELMNPTAKASADLSSSQKTKLNEIDTSMNTLNQLKNAYEQAGGGKGLVGNLSEFANSVTGGAANRNLATYNDLKNSLGMAIVKNVINAGGTEQDAKRYIAMLPSASDTPEQAEQKFAYLEEMLNNAKQSVYNY